MSSGVTSMAAEIERLREEGQRILHAKNHFFDECTELRGEIGRLRAALGEKYREGYDNALAEQSFDRAAVIEECAQFVEKSYSYGRYDLPQTIANAIRALKDKP